MARSSISCNLPIKIVLDHDNLLAAIRVRLQDALNRRVGSLAFAASNVPRVANHELEVVIGVDACAHVFVVVLKLLNRHDSITLVRLPHGHEVGEDLVSGLASTLEIWVEADIVCDSDVVDGDLAGAVLVEDAIGLVNHIEAALIKLATNGAQKLIKGQLSILVRIKVLNDLSYLDLREVQSIVTHGILELDRAQTSIAVAIHCFEH